MLLNYLKVAIRNFYKNRLYNILNLLGLTIGFSAVALIGLYLRYESSFEDFHQKADRIYRPTWHFQSEGDFEVHFARIPVNFVNELPNDIPEIEKLIRFQNQESRYIRIGQEKFKPKHAYVTDADVFEVFDFPLLEGDPKTALSQPNSIVISQRLAQTYFGNEPALGKELFVSSDYQAEETIYQIQGIMADVPAQTHLPAELFFSFPNPEARSGWAYVYTLLSEGITIQDIEAKMPEFMAKYRDANAPGSIDLEFQALKDIHLHSHLAREIVPNGNPLYVQLFGIVAIFILLIALFNFINLSSAMAIGRGKEVGMRSILGASKGQLIGAALVESIMYNLIAAVLALGICAWVLPYFNQMSQQSLVMDVPLLLTGLGMMALIGGILAGIYPAFVLTSFHALDAVRQKRSLNLRKKSGLFSFKRLMVGLQFSASIMLIASTLIAARQVHYLHNKQLGLKKDQILAISAVPSQVKENYLTFSQRIQSLPGLAGISSCMEVPSREIRDAGPVLVQGRNMEIERAPMMDMQVVSAGFTEMMGMEILAGKDRIGELPFDKPEFTEEFTPQIYMNQRKRFYMINETAMKQLGWNDPEEAIGQQINWSIGGFELAYGPITAVVKDFHQETLKNTIDPTIMTFEPVWLGIFLVKLHQASMQESLAQIQQVWDEMFPSYPMEYHFLDDLYDRLYRQEGLQLQILLLFSGLAVFIAFLGLFALIAYSLQSRMKEIAIRKVVGANPYWLVQMIGREYFWVLLLGSLLAIPLSYWALSIWLENFAYSISITPISYLLTLIFIGLLLFATIWVQVYRSHQMDLAPILREE